MAAVPSFRVFLSAVASEFRSACGSLATILRARGMQVGTPADLEDADAAVALRKLHDYIRDCSAVVCIIGRRSGPVPSEAAAQPFSTMLPAGIDRASYAQWAFFFARRHRKRISLYLADDAYVPDLAPGSDVEIPQLQQRFIEYLRSEGLSPTSFSSVTQLEFQVKMDDWPPPASVDQPIPPPISGGEKQSVYVEGENEALRFKWIESEKAGYDLGENPAGSWLKHLGPGCSQGRLLEHLAGKRFWVELDRSTFGALRRVTDPQLLALAAERLLGTSNAVARVQPMEACPTPPASKDPVDCTVFARQPKNEEPVAPSVKDPVDCTVFAPPRAAAGDAVFVQVFAHRPDQAAVAEQLAGLFDDQAEKRGFKSLEIEIVRGSKMTFHLVLPGLAIDEAVQHLVWQGRAESVQFAATVPATCKPSAVIGTLTVSQDGVPIGHIKFKLAVTASGLEATPVRNEPAGTGVARYGKAFISYASADRNEVLKRVQMLRHVGIEFFQDLLDLEPGDRWEQQLYRHIDESDLFLLFWSSSARKSTWVLKEIQYALKRKAGDELAKPEIAPVILEGPPPPPPPDELAHLHFNDYLTYFIGRS